MSAEASSAPLRLRSERIVTPDGVLAGEVVVREGRICAVGSDRHQGELIDLGTDWIVPGYIDTHVHGGAGAQCNTTDPDELAAVAAFHARHGTTALLATTVPADPDRLRPALGAIGSVRRAAGSRDAAGATILGVHLEGPFLSPRRAGALDPAAFRAPDPELLDSLLAAADGAVRLVTLAPELPGALELVARLGTNGIVASLGHSDAGYEDAVAAVHAGARAATHVFNAMAPLHHRRPGLLGAVLDHNELSCELIVDGIHVAAPAMRLAHRAKGTAGIRLVTDAIAGAGMPDGDYRLGDSAVRVGRGRAQLVDGGGLAGSVLTMDAAVRLAVRELGVELGDAVAMASANPARLLGLYGKGAIVPGRDADLAVLGDDLNARATLVAGAWAFGP